MAHLWDEMDDTAELQQDIVQKDLTRLNPEQLVTFEANNEKTLIKTTGDFAKQLKCCEEIAIAAYRVADYVPPTSTEEQERFWRGKVIPILVNTLSQDVKARAEIVKGFGAIRDLSLVIKSAHELVRRSKGSKKAIEIAKKNIPAALAVLDRCIDRAELLDTNVIAKFGEVTGEIFNMVGPETAKLADEEEEVSEKIDRLYEKLKKVYAEIGRQKGEMEKYDCLIQASEQHVTNSQDDIEESKRRAEELDEMNKSLHNTMKNIPDSFTNTTTTKWNEGYWWWWSRKGSTRTNTEEVANTEKKAHLEHYRKIVAANQERIKREQMNEKEREQNVERLEANIAEYKEKFKLAKDILTKLQKDLPEQEAQFRKDMAHLRQQKDKIKQRSLDMYTTIGHQGNTLVRCLIEVRQFSKTLRPGASAYTPLFSILTGIRAMVQNSVDMLSSELPEDIFLAGALLNEQVGFLSNYLVRAQHILKPSEEYNAVESEKMMKAITLDDN